VVLRNGTFRHAVKEKRGRLLGRVGSNRETTWGRAGKKEVYHEGKNNPPSGTIFVRGGPAVSIRPGGKKGSGNRKEKRRI